MKKHTDPWVDEFIANAEPFAQPILHHLRKLVHEVCPEVEETKKWSFPNFMYKGAIMCGMAAFKQHCSFGFWKASIMPDPDGIFVVQDAGMGNIGKIHSLKDLPSDSIMKKYIREAMMLNETGAKVPKKPKDPAPKELVVPDYFIEALKADPKAEKAFEAFSYSMKKEYVQWITEAKTEPTRLKRIATSLDWIANGKGRNWKYEKC